MREIPDSLTVVPTALSCAVCVICAILTHLYMAKVYTAAVNLETAFLAPPATTSLEICPLDLQRPRVPDIRYK